MVNGSQSIAVVGGGPLGLVLSAVLSQRDFPITLFEQRPLPYWQNHGSDSDARRLILSYGSILQLKSWGLWDRLEPFALPFQKVHVSDRGRVGRLRLNASDLNLPFLGASLNLTDVLQVAFEMAQDQGVQFRDRTPIDRLERQTNGVQVCGPGENFSASFVVLAEGGFSSFGNQTPPPSTTPVTHARVWRLRTQADAPPFVLNQIFQRLIPDQLLAFVPQDPHTAVVIASSTLKLDVAGSETLAFIQKAFQGLICIPLESTVLSEQAFSVQERIVPEPYSDRVLMMGNAAHALAPVAAQGFNLALRDIGAFLDAWPDPKSTPNWDTYNTSRTADLQRTQSPLKYLSQTALPSALHPFRSLALFGLDSCPPTRQALVRWGIGMREPH